MLFRKDTEAEREGKRKRDKVERAVGAEISGPGSRDCRRRKIVSSGDENIQRFNKIFLFDKISRIRSVATSKGKVCGWYELDEKKMVQELRENVIVWAHDT